MFCLIDCVRKKPFLLIAVLSFTSIFLMPHLVTTFRNATPSLFRIFSVATMASSQQARPPVEPYSMAFVTAPNKDVAKTLASGIDFQFYGSALSVSKKLAACVNIIPGLTSVYEWEGKINTDDEVLMMIKTRTSRVEELTEYVKSNHPYEVCEVITTSIEKGNRDYLDWIGKTVPEKSDA